jgi:AAA domain
MRERTNAELDAEVIDLDAKRKEPRIKLVPFDKIQLGTDRRYLVKGIIAYPGISVIWGPPKSGKSFWAFDLVMRVALGWEYRGKRIHQGPAVYCCFEGQTGIRARVEAFRQKFLGEDTEGVPFFLQPVTIDLVKEHTDLIAAIRTTLTEMPPVVVVLDTLNRSLVGSESSDTDMSNYVRAADAIRDAFSCSVIIVHHCGINDTRPRGHTSLTGAADAQLAVKRDINGTICVTVEFMKDGEAGEIIASELEPVDVGTDEDGDPIASRVVVEAEAPANSPKGPRLTPNQATMLGVLQRSSRPLNGDEWTEEAREAGLDIKRKATFWDLRKALLDKGLVYEGANGWLPK